MALKVGAETAVSASPWNLLEMQILRLTYWIKNSEGGPSNMHFNKPNR